MAVRTLVVEDDTFTRVTLAESLRAQGVDVVLATDRAADALDAARAGPVHAAFLDLHLGAGPTGLDLAVALRRLVPTIGIVLLTSFDDPRLLSATLPDPPPGAQYVTKRSVGGVETLVAALRDAVESAPRGGPAAARRGRGSRAGDPHSAVHGLTDTQVETLRLVAQGHSNAEIARRRGVSEGSVEATITRLARALDVEVQATRNQRVHMAQVYFRSLGVRLSDDDPAEESTPGPSQEPPSEQPVGPSDDA